MNQKQIVLLVLIIANFIATKEFLRSTETQYDSSPYGYGQNYGHNVAYKHNRDVAYGAPNVAYGKSSQVDYLPKREVAYGAQKIAYGEPRQVAYKHNRDVSYGAKSVGYGQNYGYNQDYAY